MKILQFFSLTLFTLFLSSPFILSAQNGTSSGQGPHEFTMQNVPAANAGFSATLEDFQKGSTNSTLSKDQRAQNKAVTDATFKELQDYCRNLQGVTLEGSVNENAGECTTEDGKPGKLKRWSEFNGNLAGDLLTNLDKFKLTCTGSISSTPPGSGSTSWKITPNNPNGGRRRDSDTDTKPYLWCATTEKSECVPLPDKTEEELDAEVLAILELMLLPPS